MKAMAGKAAGPVKGAAMKAYQAAAPAKGAKGFAKKAGPVERRKNGRLLDKYR